MDDAIEPDFEPRVQRPPCPPNLHSPLEVMQEWDAVFVTKIRRCGEVLQWHRCCCVCHKYGKED